MKSRFTVNAALLVCACWPMAGLAAETAEGADCQFPGNLLQQHDFAAPEGERSAWRYAQHSSDVSFVTRVDDGVLTVERTGNEPWFVAQQRVEHPDLPGATVRFAAELESATSAEPASHGFPHVTGLYYRVGRTVYQAEHAPNVGEWDWRPFSVEFTLPGDARWLEVGIIHQANGVIRVRSPSLTFAACDNV